MVKRQRHPESALPHSVWADAVRRRFRDRALAACLVFAGAGAIAAQASAASFQLPPIVDPATQEHHAGKVIFVELATPDLAAAERFYGALFGWTFRDVQAGATAYGEALLDGRPVAGLVQKPLPAGAPMKPSWLGFIAVPDVDAAEKSALQNGAKLLREPHDVPGRGRQAVLADPQGAVFAILASSSGDTPDVMAEPGEWIWSSLIASDPDTDAAFYQTVFGYEVFETPGPDGAEHLTLATDNYARASANPPPTGKPGMHPHWMNFVRVDDAEKAAAKVAALGGRVIVQPRVDRHGGKLAIVADPSGAPFGLMEWPESESKDVTEGKEVTPGTEVTK